MIYCSSEEIGGHPKVDPYSLGRDAIIDLPTVLLVLGSAFLLFRFHLNSLWLVIGGALIGFLNYVMRM